MFQSTHSLRSATLDSVIFQVVQVVSIHALLAECDSIRSRLLSLCVVSIHALLAECDRPEALSNGGRFVSIHALLAECDIGALPEHEMEISFNPRTPCGVRLTGANARPAGVFVSIHALLAECDATDFIHYYSTEQIILCANLPKKTVIARLHFLSIYLSIFYSQCITPIADLPGNSCELEVGAQAMFHSL